MIQETIHQCELCHTKTGVMVMLGTETALCLKCDEMLSFAKKLVKHLETKK